MGDKKSLNVLSHNLVPKMEIVSDSQKKKILEEFGVEEEYIPKMHHTDPASIALSAKVGDLIKIHRKDPTAKYVYYRIIV